jgi:protein-L-isoaspartate(D-aspartate) O-methyltransferase
MLDLARARNRMVDVQIARRGVRDAHVLDAMRHVPREHFVEKSLKESAYEDLPLPIGEQQTVSQPFMVAMMIEAAKVGPGDRVLEIGTGSGYAAAVLSLIASEVYTVERYRSLADEAQRRFTELGYANITARTGDGTLGWPEAAPFDAIVVAAGSPDVPSPLKEQLAIGGRLVIPVGDQDRRQTLVKITRTGGDSFEEEDLGAVMFVPLVGERGWREDRSSPRARPGPAKNAGP